MIKMQQIENSRLLMNLQGMKVTEVTVKVGGTALTPGTDTYSLVKC